jgi:HEAT repeat protein
MRPVVALCDDLMLVGDFEAADTLIGILVSERLGSSHGQAAVSAINALVAGPMMRHACGHLATLEDTPFECLKKIFLAIGDPMITPLAEALIEECDPRTCARLTAMFIAFGPSARREVERLKSSPTAFVRRTAVNLLRHFGGSEALSDLSGFVNDDEALVQRDAVHAILGIGTDRAYAVLGRSVIDGNPAQREAIMTAVAAAREERCAPLFAYILRHADHRGPLTDLYVRAIKALGSLKDCDSIGALTEALHRGEWWAPRRTTALRDASAAALARIGSDDALAALTDAAASPSRGVRAAARAHLAGAANSQPDRPGR